MGVDIRPIRTVAEYHGCEAIQRGAWAMSQDLEVVPLHLLITAHKNGGMLLGAFDAGELVGFVFGFVGLTSEGKVKHCSHMMGVMPGVQSRGVGYQLKLAQREFVLAQGLDLITWTYDPLESRNAYLNVAKLGAVCCTYVRDLYGPMTDGLNSGLPSDRCEMEWWIKTNWVAGRVKGRPLHPGVESIPQVNPTHVTAAGFVAPEYGIAETDAPTIQIEIPSDYQAIKAADPALAREWRLATRQVFESCFGAGYRVLGFSRSSRGAVPRSHYLLSREADAFSAL